MRVNNMQRIVALALGLAIGLIVAGCATTPAPVAQLPATWPDARYGYDPALIAVDTPALLALDDALVAQLRSSSIQNLPLERRIQYLQTQLLGANPTPFAYRFGQSTVARQTWRERQGDCLSLTVLALAMARQLRLNAVVQEVPIAAAFDRRNGVDFRNGHVNLFIDRGPVTDSAAPMGFKPGVIIDFEPVDGAFRRGLPLSAGALLARYYNNMGAQALADRDWRHAYAYLREAVHQDPLFGPALTNLSGLYRQTGEAALAEQALHLALQRETGRETAIHALHDLWIAQGKDAQAQPLRALLEADRANDPYYWTDLGWQRLQAGDARRAIDALERAQDLANGFSEVHRYLAHAYLLDGQNAKAQAQLDTLAGIDGRDGGPPPLQSKFKAGKLYF